jgi:hypothetical protein
MKDLTKLAALPQLLPTLTVRKAKNVSHVGYVFDRLKSEDTAPALLPHVTLPELTILHKPTPARKKHLTRHRTKHAQKSPQADLDGAQKTAAVRKLQAMTTKERTLAFSTKSATDANTLSGRSLRRLWGIAGALKFDEALYIWNHRGRVPMLKMAACKEFVGIMIKKQKKRDMDGDTYDKEWNEDLTASMRQQWETLPTIKHPLGRNTDVLKLPSTSTRDRYNNGVFKALGVGVRLHTQKQSKARAAAGACLRAGVSYIATCKAVEVDIHPSMCVNADPCNLRMGLIKRGSGKTFYVCDDNETDPAHLTKPCYVNDTKQSFNPHSIKFMPCGSAAGTTGKPVFALKVSPEELGASESAVNIELHGVCASNDASAPNAILRLYATPPPLVPSSRRCTITLSII